MTARPAPRYAERVIPAAEAPTSDAAARPARGRARADSAGNVSAKPLSLLPFPAWIRRRSEATPDAHAAAFAAGAALAGLDAVVRAEPPWRGVWAQRLALRAAAACLSREGRRGEEAALRDAHALARPGDDPGPAGQVLRAWRRLVERPIRFDPEHLCRRGRGVHAADPAASARPAIRGSRDRRCRRPATRSRRPPRRQSPPPSSAPPPSFLGCGSPTPSSRNSLAGCGLCRSSLPACPTRRCAVASRSDGRARPIRTGCDACHLAYAHAAARAHDLALELDRRAHVLLTVAPRLRAKQAPKIVAALLADDAVTASSRLAGMTDRSLRRLLERLVALGAARELTGRATSRLYGL